MNDHLPQALTSALFRDVLDLCDLPSNSDLRVLFNQYGEWGSVPHLHFQVFIHETKPWAIDAAPLMEVDRRGGVTVSRIDGRLEKYPAEAVLFQGGSAQARADETVSFIEITDAAGYTHQPIVSKGRVIVAPRLKPPPQAWGAPVMAYHAAGKILVYLRRPFETMTIKDVVDRNRLASVPPLQMDHLIETYQRLTGGGRPSAAERSHKDSHRLDAVDRQAA